MKRKLLILLNVIITAFCCLGLVACEKGVNKKFNVSFIVDGETYKIVEITSETISVTMPENPKKDGYVFDGWFWDNDTFADLFTETSLLNGSITSDIKAYAKFTKAHTHEYKESTTKPTCTQKGYATHTCDCGDSYVDSYVDELGHSFTNYVSNNDATYESDGTKTARCDRANCNETVTITDVGSKLVYNRITFRTLSLDSLNNAFGKVANGVTLFSFVNEIVKSGTATYSVYLDPEYSQEVKSKNVNLEVGDNVFYVLAEKLDCEQALYIVTIRVRPIHTVTFDSLGGSIVESQSVEEDSFVAIPTTAPTKDGYIFTGWDFDFENTPVETNTTIKAKWQAISYTVKFDGNGSTSGEMAEQTFSFDQAKNLTANAFEKVGYDFVGWKYNGTAYSDCQSVENLSNENNAKMTFVAEWQAISYTVKFDGNGSTSGEMAEQTFVFDQAKNLTANAFEKVGCYFVGWQYKETTFSDGQSIEYVALENNTEYTLVAKWQTQAKYTLKGNEYVVTGYNVLVDNSVTILDEIDGKKVTAIEGEAFSGCSSLQNLILGNNLTRVGANAFVGCNALQFNEVDNALYLGNSGNQNLALIHSKNLSISSCEIASGCKIIYDYAFSGCSYLTSVVIPDTVTSIGNHAFADCSSITSVVIPNGVTKIADYAFSGCYDLQNVEIPNSVTSIGLGVFFDCPNLQYTEVDNALYLGNASSPCLALIKIIDNYITSCEIVSGCKIICPYVFNNCSSLTSVVIPNSVTSLGNSIFKSCNNLSSIRFDGTIDGWNAIEKSDGWDYNTADYVIICNDGVINKQID